MLLKRIILDCKSVVEVQCHRLLSCSVDLIERSSMVVGRSSGQSAAADTFIPSVSRKETVMTHLDAPGREHKVRATGIGPLCPLSFTVTEREDKRLRQAVSWFCEQLFQFSYPWF